MMEERAIRQPVNAKAARQGLAAYVFDQFGAGRPSVPEFEGSEIEIVSRTATILMIRVRFKDDYAPRYYVNPSQGVDMNKSDRTIVEGSVGGTSSAALFFLAQLAFVGLYLNRFSCRLFVGELIPVLAGTGHTEA